MNSSTNSKLVRCVCVCFCLWCPAKQHTYTQAHRDRNTHVAGRELRREELSFVNKELWQLAVAMGTVCCRGLVLHHKVLKLAPKPQRSHPSSTRLTSASHSLTCCYCCCLIPPVSVTDRWIAGWIEYWTTPSNSTSNTLPSSQLWQASGHHGNSHSTHRLFCLNFHPRHWSPLDWFDSA